MDPRRYAHNFLVAGLVVAFASSAPVAVVGQDSDLDSLRNEVKEIKDGQQAIQKDLQEIKKLIQAQKAPAPARRSPIQDIKGTISIENEPVNGDSKAKVVLIEFSEYQCPFCGRHAKNTAPTIAKEYVETGKIRHVLRDFPLGFHKLAPKAAEAAQCAGDQNKFWEMSTKLFENTREIGPEHLKSKAESLGLDMAQFNACLENDKHAAGVQEDMKVAANFGITGTPSFIIAVSNGDDSKLEAVKLIRGAQQLVVFKKELDEVLAKQK